MSLRIVYFGTPEFAVPPLRALAESEFRPAWVVSQPSRPAKRGQQMTEPPVVAAARDLGIPSRQVERVRDPEFLDEIAAFEPDVAVVVAFGQIFPRRLLELPRWGCVNLHASLLPRWRGAAPIQAAIAAGDSETGVTTMRMEEGLDSGPMLLTARVEIGADETAGQLSQRLAEMGGPLMVETLRGLARGVLAPSPQPESGITLAPKIRKEMARLDWGLDAGTLAARIRAFQPWPGVELPARGEWIKVLAASPGIAAEKLAPGTVVAIEKERFSVAASEGSLLTIERAQRAGRGPVSGGDLARGWRLSAGDRLV